MKKTTGGNSFAEAGQDIGKKVSHEFAGLNVVVEIVNVKFAYGKKRWEVLVSGQPKSNKLWIDAPKVWLEER